MPVGNFNTLVVKYVDLMTTFDLRIVQISRVIFLASSKILWPPFRQLSATLRHYVVRSVWLITNAQQQNIEYWISGRTSSLS